MIPLVEPLRSKGYHVRLLGKDTALQKYSERTVQDYLDFAEYLQDCTQAAIQDFLQKARPDFIITGTSADDMTEKYLWKAAEDLAVPCFAILDQWVNYGIRFSAYGVSELREYNADKRHPYLPMKIVVMDDYAQREMVNEGIPESRILVCGQPHFEYLLSQSHDGGGNHVRDRLGIAESDFVLTFASEPISKAYGETDVSEHYWGYTERTIFRDLLKAISTVMHDTKRKAWVIVRPHPKEDVASFGDFLRLQLPNITIVRDTETSSLDLICASQLICGMSSMFLIESIIFRKPVLSIQIGLNRADPFTLSRRGVLKSITDEKTLLRELKSFIVDHANPVYDFPIVEHPVENIIRSMEKSLCQN